jgi:hypothetical protein
MPPRLHDKYLKRFDELVTEGQAILANPEVRIVNRDVYGDAALLGLGSMEETHEYIDSGRFHEWQSKWATLLGQMVPPTHPKSNDIKQLSSSGVSKSILEEMLAILRAVKSDYESGFLDDLPALIRAEVAGDYMAQAEMLLAEGYHVPAAVLSGVVLEDALRKLCNQHDIPIVDAKGARKTINPMNMDLYKKNLYNAAKMQEIQAWAGYRNDCAHGDGDKVKPEDVGRMIQGVRAFVADYLK